MRKFWLTGTAAAVLFCAGMAEAASENFDAGWLLHKGDTGAASQIAVDDTGWIKVDLPNDWAISGPFDQAAPSTGSGGWLPTGVVWYRKHFTRPAGQRAAIRFDGVMDRSGVWINGHHLGFRLRATRLLNTT